MRTDLAVLEAEALKLSAEDRILLADHVLASVRAQNEVEQAWGAEIDRRLAEVEAGAVKLIPAEQAVARARLHLGVRAGGGASCRAAASRRTLAWGGSPSPVAPIPL